MVLCVKTVLANPDSTTANETVEKSIFEDCPDFASMNKALHLIAQSFSNGQPGSHTKVPKPGVDLTPSRSMARLQVSFLERSRGSLEFGMAYR